MMLMTNAIFMWKLTILDTVRFIIDSQDFKPRQLNMFLYIVSYNHVLHMEIMMFRGAFVRLLGARTTIWVSITSSLVIELNLKLLVGHLIPKPKEFSMEILGIMIERHIGKEEGIFN